MLTLPKAKARFQFQIEGEKTVYSIPYPKDLPLEFTNELAALQTSDDESRGVSFVELFVKVLNEYAEGSTRRISAEALGILVSAWAGSDMGEQ